ncbi:MAG: sugar kinase [Lachnospiraceae bacterium]|nr:sugar kinase [Lachnospiraceae bacterium]
MKAVCFGEIMMRLNPVGYRRFRQAEEFQASYAGGEANVAVSLVNYGIETAYVTKVPAHEIGSCVIDTLRKFGVDTKWVLRGGPRLGIYFVEKGASQRPSKVIYDRAGSSIALAEPSEFDWENIFKGSDWFHFTGITPALSENMAAACMDAVKEAKRQGLTVSCDLNYRNKLWSKERAGEVMSSLMPYVDVCIANEEDAADVFGIRAENTDVNSGKLDKEGYVSVAKQLVDRFSFKKVAITLRTSISASVNNWAGMLYDGEPHFSKEYQIQIVDRVGGGDSFGGGLIYSLMNGADADEAIEFAVAASCLKHTIEFDFNLVTADEVKSLALGNASGRVQR